MVLQWRGSRTFSLDPKDRQFFENPYPFYQQMHARGGPVYWQQYDMWCLADFASVDRCLRDRRFARLPPPGFEKPPYPAHLQAFARTEQYSLLALEPPQHTRLRKLVNRAFVSRQVESMANEISALTHRCIDRFAADGEAELLSAFASPVPVIVIARLLGVPEQAADDLLEWSHAMVKVYTLVQSKEDELAADRASQQFIEFLLEQIAVHRRKPGPGLLSQLLAQQSEPDGPTDDEIISTVILLLNAGHEATVHQIGNSIVNILTQPPANDQWFRDQTQTEQVVAECLRHDAPLHLFIRYAQEEISLHEEVTLQPGEQVALLLGAANRCPVQFEQHDHFNPQRTDQQTVTFGAGIHFCVGTPLARLELKIALATLFERLPGMQLAGKPTYRDSFHFHGYDEVRVRWPRH